MASSRSKGYGPSILQPGEYCYLCGRRDRKLDRHEIFGGAYREKSKQDGLWVLLCHDDCHLGRNGAHGSREVREYLKSAAQARAMTVYGWTVDEFIKRYGKNYW